MGAAAILGGASLVQNYIAQQDANSSRNRAISIEEQKAQREQALQDRAVANFDEVQKAVRAARMGGAFDPGKWRKAFVDKARPMIESLQHGQTTGLTSMGYKPTDSEYKHRTDKLQRTLDRDLAVGEHQAGLDALSAETNALQAGNPSLGLSGGFGGSSNLSNIYMQGAQDSTPNWGASVAGILPLIQSWGKKNQGQSRGDGTGPDGQTLFQM